MYCFICIVFHNDKPFLEENFKNISTVSDGY